MKKLFLLFSLFILTNAYSQPITINRDPEIEQMVQEISKDSLQSYITRLVGFGTRHLLSTQTNPKRGIGAARNYVLQKFKEFAAFSGGRLNAFIDTTTLHADHRRVDRDVLLGNVMGVLKGTDTADHRIFIISGHLDSRRTNVMDSVGDAPGANDDGSGTAAMMECARVMSKHTFPATIIFVAVTGEEQGLLGSTFLSNKAKKENWDVAAMINNDMIGNNNSSGTDNISNMELRVFSEGIPHYKTEEQIRKILFLGLENDGASRQFARYVKETGERYVDNMHIILEYRTDRFLRGGDHEPFLNNGFTAVRLTDMYENFTRQHQDIRVENGIHFGDVISGVDFEYLRKNTGINLATLANLAKSPGQPQDVKVEVKELTNSTDLKWDIPREHKPAGYYILMRPTASSMWQKKFFTKDTSIRLPYSKDNYFFAVQAVSGTGNESLPVVPGIGR